MRNAWMTIVTWTRIHRLRPPQPAWWLLLVGANILGGASHTHGRRAQERERKQSDVRQLPKLTLPRAEGGATSLQELRGERGTVLVFLSTECPISNGYIPTLNELSNTWADRGVQVVGLNRRLGGERR